MKKLAVAALAALSFAASAQSLPPPQDVLNLSASGTIEVTEDLVTISLSTTKMGRDATLVQSQLKAALDAALSEARKSSQPGQMDLRTGGFSIGPRYTNTGPDGWQGTAELVLEGRDFTRIATVAGRLGTMTVSGVSFGLSRDTRAKVESDAQKIAIERFRAKAAELARGFGFSGYSLREVSVTSNGAGMPRPYAMAASAMRAEAGPVPVEAGKSAVTVTVSGSVQLK
ncbi:MAG TPA: SIMPL domain-containing protein [Ramlibacter sp.]|jgi:predicted secreted protein